MFKGVIALAMMFSTAVGSSTEREMDYYHSCEYPDRQTELTALACNLYFEGRGESLVGRQAILFVTINRAESKRFPSSIVDVVYQPMQFSWHTDGLSDKVKDLTAWKDAMHIASWVLGVSNKDYLYADVTEGSLFYHSTKVSPLWAEDNNIVVRIDNHLFYREDKKK